MSKAWLGINLHPSCCHLQDFLCTREDLGTVQSWLWWLLRDSWTTNSSIPRPLATHSTFLLKEVCWPTYQVYYKYWNFFQVERNIDKMGSENSAYFQGFDTWNQPIVDCFLFLGNVELVINCKLLILCHSGQGILVFLEVYLPLSEEITVIVYDLICSA